jgi:hypothetical protein
MVTASIVVLLYAIFIVCTDTTIVTLFNTTVDLVLVAFGPKMGLS